MSRNVDGLRMSIPKLRENSSKGFLQQHLNFELLSSDSSDSVIKKTLWKSLFLIVWQSWTEHCLKYYWIKIFHTKIEEKQFHSMFQMDSCDKNLYLKYVSSDEVFKILLWKSLFSNSLIILQWSLSKELMNIYWSYQNEGKSLF